MQYSTLYGANGIGFYVQDTQSGSQTDRQQAINDAYVELAGIKGYWRKRTATITSSSTPAFTVGSSTISVPSDFESPYRLYYRESGMVVPIDIIEEDEWLLKSDTSSTAGGDPEWARLQEDSNGQYLELDKVISSQFNNRIGTIYLEYFIEITRLSDDADVPIFPANYHHHIIAVGAYKYAIAQGDAVLARLLTQPQGRSRLSLVEEAFAQVRRHDLTRTGRPGKITPKNHYSPQGMGAGSRDYGLKD